MLPKNIRKVCKTKVELLATLQDLEVPDKVWIELSFVVGNFFAERASAKADQVA